MYKTIKDSLDNGDLFFILGETYIYIQVFISTSFTLLLTDRFSPPGWICIKPPTIIFNNRGVPAQEHVY